MSRLNAFEMSFRFHYFYGNLPIVGNRMIVFVSFIDGTELIDLLESCFDKKSSRANISMGDLPLSSEFVVSLTTTPYLRRNQRASYSNLTCYFSFSLSYSSKSESSQTSLIPMTVSHYPSFKINFFWADKMFSFFLWLV